MSFRDPLRLEFLDGRKWRVLEDFSYWHGDLLTGFYIKVPKDFETDFASVPRFFWRLLPPTGEYGKAAVLHDWLYAQNGMVSGQCLTRAQCDEIFRDAMDKLGVPKWKVQSMFRAVRMFGRGAWKACTKPLPAPVPAP
jgi:hypothetical protein